MDLTLENLSLEIEGNLIFEDLNLRLLPGEVHIVLGPNGVGKSSLLKVISGHPGYSMAHGKICLAGEDISQKTPEKRAQQGIFVAFQEPCEIEGLSVANFLRTTLKAYPQNPAYNWSATVFYEKLYSLLEAVGLPKNFTSRSVNCGFSGGERKRFELLQLLLFKPKFALLDELDSGLDIDAKKLVLTTIEKLRQDLKMGFLIVSHDLDFVRNLRPDGIHLLRDKRWITMNLTELDKVEEGGFNKL